jgi:UDP-galactopyranose mutase
VTPYGEEGLVRIADSVPDTIAALQAALDEDSESRWPRIDAFLCDMSWDRTWTSMSELVDEVVGVSSQEPEDMNVAALSPIELWEAELNV